MTGFFFAYIISEANGEIICKFQLTVLKNERHIF
jgi:hypothetical protein